MSHGDLLSQVRRWDYGYGSCGCRLHNKCENDLQSNVMDNEIVAVKVGDVTENAVANLTSANTSEIRSGKSLDLVIEDRAVVEGEKVAVAISSDNFSQVFGYQFTMELKGLEFTGIEGGVVVMRDGNVGVLSSEILTISYNNMIALNANANEDLFTLHFVAERSGQLSEMIDLTSKVTKAEAYAALSTSAGVAQEFEAVNVNLTTRGLENDITESVLYQNEPNPFRTQTSIGFDLAQAGPVNLTIVDVTGKVIVNKTLEGKRGYNEVSLKSSELGTSGLLYYTVESGEFTATKKMIVIK